MCVLLEGAAQCQCLFVQISRHVYMKFKIGLINSNALQWIAVVSDLNPLGFAVGSSTYMYIMFI